MKIAFMMGNAPRHHYILKKIMETNAEVLAVREYREAYKPQAPIGIDSHLKDLFLQHFNGREDAEMNFFGKDLETRIHYHDISREQLNSDEVISKVANFRPDLLISYGVHILKDHFLDAIPCEKWNVHGGLSPWYRGSITHFWPSYFLEPQMTGITLHQTTNKLDGGDMIHNTLAPLVSGDGVHELACRCVQKFGNELSAVLDLKKKNQLVASYPQKSTGRLFKNSDWRPEHLRVIYDLYENKVVNYYLKGYFQKKEVNVFRQKITDGLE